MAMNKYKPFLYQYAVWAVFGSAAIHLLWTKNEYREYKERMDFKISKLEDLIERLKRDAGGRFVNDTVLAKSIPP
ncbi:9920_t:CDS:1, partial [Racocetra fulgida]